MPSYNAYERVQIIMAYLHSEPGHRRQTPASISNATDIPQGSINKTIYYDFPDVFDRSPVHKGITLTGLWPGDEPFDLDKVSKEWLKTRKEQHQTEKLKAAYFDAGFKVLAQTLSKREYEILMSYLGRNRETSFTEIKDIFNAAQVIVILCNVVRSPDREATFGRYVEGSSPTIEKIIKRGKT